MGGRLAVLDGLRGIAIVIVVWFHIWEWTWLNPHVRFFGTDVSLTFISATGFTGVDLFFFISGFVLFYPYARHAFAAAELPTLQHFAYRRFIKIVPSYYLQIALLTPVIAAAYSGAGLAWQYLAHLTFIFNWFGSTYGAINGVWWTLAVEVQFYVLFPLLCWSFCRWPLASFGAMLLVANAYRLALARCCLGDTLLMTQLPSFFDLFACGMFAAYAFVLLHEMRLSARWAAAFTALSIAGFLAYGGLLYRLYELHALASWAQVWANSDLTWLGLSFVAIAVGGCLGASWLRVALSNRALAFFALISYNLYLWHQLVANYVGEHVRLLQRPAGFQADVRWQLTFTAVAALLSIALAAIITFAFERPLLALGFKGVGARLLAGAQFTGSEESSGS
ncbi:MAG: acyltransferase [Candidatus Eremiobacteraeota bacterium]|nr:acyltransferase [Candidatus Eremiobacteraeota bacterium]